MVNDLQEYISLSLSLLNFRYIFPNGKRQPLIQTHLQIPLQIDCPAAKQQNPVNQNVESWKIFNYQFWLMVRNNSNKSFHIKAILVTE